MDTSKDLHLDRDLVLETLLAMKCDRKKAFNQLLVYMLEASSDSD